MSYSGGIITAPVSIADVKAVLGESSNNLADLCTSDNINWWSKCKPYSGGKLFVNGSDTNFGWTPAYVNDVSSVKSLYDDSSTYKGYPLNSWTYKEQSPNYYRLADFKNYNHNASSPAIGFAGTTSTTTNGTLSYQCAYDISSGESSESASPTLNEFNSSLKDYYFGVVLYRGSTRMYTQTTTTTLSDKDGDMSIQFTGSFSTDTYTAYPFLSSIQIKVNDAESVGTYYSIPGTKPVTTKVTTTSTAYSKYYFTGSYKSGVVSGTLYNKTGNIIQNAYIYIRFSTSSQSDAMQIGEYIINVGRMVSGTSFDVMRAVDYPNKTYVVDIYGDNQFIRREMLAEEIDPGLDE